MTDNRFSEAFLEEIKGRVSISEVIGQSVSWDKEKTSPGRGDYWACCPFHGESTPSFHCEDTKGLYHCFGCGVSGDHLKFLMESAGKTFPEAVEIVAEMAGVPLPGQDGVNKSTRPVERRPADLPREESPKGKWTIVRAYPYTDRDGELTYESCRIGWQLPDRTLELGKNGKPKKTFVQRRPSRVGDNSWIWGLGAGEFMRAGPGKDWRAFDEEKFAQLERGERRVFTDEVEHGLYHWQALERGIAAGQPVFLPEGERKVETIEEWGFVATCNSGGAKNWTAKLVEAFRGADVIIMVDNDETGRDRGEAVAASLRGVAARVRVLDLAPHWPGMAEKDDVVDWAERGGGDRQKLEAIVAGLKDWRPRRPASKFNAIGLGDVDKQAAKHSWLVQDMIELLGSASFAGFTQSGKSFLMIDLAFCVSRGTPFWGRPVTQGLVIYQVGEGELGFFKRVQGYQQDRGFAEDKSIPIEFLPKKINLFVDDKDTEALIAECKALEQYHGIKLRLVVIDTLNKATRGSNEISGQDNGKIIERIERIARECECTVLVVDHLSAQGRLRGHTSKSDDMTNVVKVSAMDKVDRNGRTIRKFVLDKNKDGEKGGETHFVLRQVTVGFDDLGRPITTCVVDEPDGDVASEVAKGHLSMLQALLLRTIKDTAEISGEAAPPELVQVPPGRNVAKWTDVLDRARKTWTFTATDPAKRESELLRIVKDAGNRLYMARYIDRDNSRGLIWWTGKSERPRQAARPAEPPTISPGMKEAIGMDVPF